MEVLKGKKLIKKNGELVSAEETLRNLDYIIYYFSASWSTSCVNFLPKLIALYEEAKKHAIKLEIVYVSSDRMEKEMMENFRKKHADWYAIPVGDAVADILRMTYSITAMPTLVVLKNNGEVITLEGVNEIKKFGIHALGTWLYTNTE